MKNGECRGASPSAGCLRVSFRYNIFPFLKRKGALLMAAQGLESEGSQEVRGPSYAWASWGGDSPGYLYRTIFLAVFHASSICRFTATNSWTVIFRYRSIFLAALNAPSNRRFSLPNFPMMGPAKLP